jgi:hypothetical protein
LRNQRSDDSTYTDNIMCVYSVAGRAPVTWIGSSRADTYDVCFEILGGSLGESLNVYKVVKTNFFLLLALEALKKIRLIVR